MNFLKHPASSCLTILLCSGMLLQTACVRDYVFEPLDSPIPHPPSRQAEPIPEPVLTLPPWPDEFPELPPPIDPGPVDIPERRESDRSDIETKEDNSRRQVEQEANEPAVFRGDRRITAMDQSNDPLDLSITLAIRRYITSDESLSVRAHNVLIVTRSGKVYLDGTVESEKEKRIIEETAAHVAGLDDVRSNLAIR